MIRVSVRMIEAYGQRPVVSLLPVPMLAIHRHCFRD